MEYPKSAELGLILLIQASYQDKAHQVIDNIALTLNNETAGDNNSLSWRSHEKPTTQEIYQKETSIALMLLTSASVSAELGLIAENLQSN